MDEYSSNKQAEDAQKQKQTFERVQHMRTAVKSAEGKDKIAAAYSEYTKDSTYRQSDAYQAAQKISKAVDYASILAADNHAVQNRSTFDKKSDTAKQAILDEYQQTARGLLRTDFGSDYLRTNTHQSIAELGTVNFETALTQKEIEDLTDWMSHPSRGPLGQDSVSLLTKHGIDPNKCNASYLRSRVAVILKDGKVTTTKAADSKQRQAAATMMKDKRSLSTEDISTVMDTVRTKRLGELSSTNESVRRFLEQHPQQDRRAWKDVIQKSKHAQEKVATRGIDLADEFLDEDAVESVEEIFDDLGDITDSTGLFQKNALRSISNALLGEMAAPINTAIMIGGVGKKVGNAIYNRHLRKSTNKSTEVFRKNMLSARESLRSAAGREARYNAKNTIKDLRDKQKFDHRQTKLHGKGKTNPKVYKPKDRKAYQNTLKAKVLKKLDNPISRFIGKIFGVKDAIKKFIMGIIKKVLLFVAKGFLCLIAGAVVVTPIFILMFLVISTFLSMFKCLEPKYAQNCINNLNYLDKWYVQAIENDIYYDHVAKDESGDPTAKSKFVHPDYETYIGFTKEGAKVGKFIDEYGNEVSSGNNILPIFTAFKFRTGAEIGEANYVAASAYGQMLYWRTHKVSEEYVVTAGGEKEEKRDIVTCSDSNLNSCPNPYKHKLGRNDASVVDRPYSLFLGTETDDGLHREYCDNYKIEIKTTGFNGKCYGQNMLSHPKHIPSCYRSYVVTTLVCEIPNHEHVDSCYETVTTLICEIPNHEHVDSCYETVTNLVCEIPSHEHVDSCYEKKTETVLNCDIPLHEHNFAYTPIISNYYTRTGISSDGTTPLYSDTPNGYGVTGWTTVCGEITVTCLGHCPGHLNVERNVQCIMDIKDIVKEDDLVFTPDALTFGSDVSQGAGTREWKNLIDDDGPANLEDFYETCIENVTYGSGAREAILFRDYKEESASDSDTTNRAIFYNNESLQDQFLNDLQFGNLTSEQRDAFKFNLSYNFRNNDPLNRYAVNVRIPVLSKKESAESASDKAIAKFREELKEKYGLKDIVSETVTNAADYLSPFIFDGFYLAEEFPTLPTIKHYLFRNGWGYFAKNNHAPDGTGRGKWTWFVNEKLLDSVSGSYAEGYQYAIEAFQSESRLYFNNSVSPVNLDTIENPLLKNVIVAVRAMKEDIKNGNSSAPDSAASAFKSLFNYMRGSRSWSSNSYPDTFYRFGTPVIEEDTILGKKFLTNTENTSASSSWNNQVFGYHYVYVIGEAEDVGNRGGRETYYHCLIYDVDKNYLFRFVTLSERELEFYTSSFPKASVSNK